MFKRSLFFVSSVLISACGVIPDLHLGKDQGVPPVNGTTTLTIPQNYKCGDPIPAPQNYTVTSTGTATACVFTFKQSVTALKASDYSSNPELAGAQAVNGIDIVVGKFAVIDPATGKTPTGLTDLTGQAFGQTILTKADLTTPVPFTKTVKGAAVDALKSEVQAKKDIVIPINVVATVALSPTPPASINLDFQAQPELDIGF